MFGFSGESGWLQSTKKTEFKRVKHKVKKRSETRTKALKHGEKKGLKGRLDYFYYAEIISRETQYTRQRKFSYNWTFSFFFKFIILNNVNKIYILAATLF